MKRRKSEPRRPEWKLNPEKKKAGAYLTSEPARRKGELSKEKKLKKNDRENSLTMRLIVRWIII